MEQFSHVELQHVIRKYDAEFKRTKRQLLDVEAKVQTLIEENKEIDDEKTKLEEQIGERDQKIEELEGKDNKAK